MKTPCLLTLLPFTIGNPDEVNIRLAFGKAADISLSWNVRDGSSCDSVHYGRTKSELNYTAKAERTCKLYRGDDMNHASLMDLEPDTEYFASLSCSDQVISFRTAPQPDTKKSFSFGVYADLGPINGEDTLSALKSVQSSLVGHLFAGDIGYADDAFMHGQTFIGRTIQFVEEISSSAGSIPIMVAPGNHEAEDHTPVCLLSRACREGFGNFSAYNCIWNMPSIESRHSMWYSFDYGPIHFVMTNTETDYEGAPLEPYGEVGFIPTGSFGEPGEYERWLRSDILKAHEERHIRPYIIVVGHRPITVLDDASDPFVTPLNQDMINLIGTYADAYISGHVHYYARSIPKPHAAFKAISITVGGSGCDEWSERVIQNTCSGETETMEFFGFGDEQTVGFLNFDADRPDELVFELKRSRNLQLVDRIVIPKRRDRKNVGTPVVITQ
jgi:hypothetical protein